MFYVLILVPIVDSVGAWDTPQQWGCGFRIVAQVANHTEDQRFFSALMGILLQPQKCLEIHREWRYSLHGKI